MAKLIKADGTEQEVKPVSGIFTNTELHNLVGGFLTGHTLTNDDQGLFMFMDDESIINGRPENRAATQLLHHYRKDLVHQKIYGDVVIAGTDETGAE